MITSAVGDGDSSSRTDTGVGNSVTNGSSLGPADSTEADGSSVSNGTAVSTYAVEVGITSASDSYGAVADGSDRDTSGVLVKSSDASGASVGVNLGLVDSWAELEGDGVLYTTKLSHADSDGE